MQPRRVATIIMYLGGTGADSAELSGGHTIFPCLRTQGGGAPLLGAAECVAIGELFADGVHVATALRLRLQSNRSQFMTIIVYDGMRRRGAPLLRLLSRLSVPLLQLSLYYYSQNVRQESGRSSRGTTSQLPSTHPVRAEVV
jgi:hypothetical protein